MATNTKIIATIGPACDNKETLQEMVDAGVGTFRVNMSHGDSSAKKRLFDLVKSIELNDGDTLSISNDEGSGDITVLVEFPFPI